MKIKGFYRFNGKTEAGSKTEIAKTIEGLRGKIEEMFGSFTFEILDAKELPEDKNYYRDEQRCFRVYFTAEFKNSSLKKKDIEDVSLYFYTDIEK